MKLSFFRTLDYSVRDQINVRMGLSSNTSDFPFPSRLYVELTAQLRTEVLLSSCPCGKKEPLRWNKAESTSSRKSLFISRQSQ